MIGIIGDASYAARVYIKKTAWFRLGSLIAVSIYTLLWLGWLIYLHVIVFNHEGKVCSGHYLTDDLKDLEVIPGYAIVQGKVLKNLIIGIWCANGAIILLTVIASIVAVRYLKSRKDEN